MADGQTRVRNPKTGAEYDVKLTDIGSSLYAVATAVDAALPAGTALIGKVGIDQATANANEVVVKSITAGTNLIGKVSIDQETANANEVVVKSITALGALEATTPTEYNITLTNANTEYSQALPANTRRLCFRCRTGVQVRYAWVTGKVAGSTAPYQSLAAGAEYALDGVKLAATTLHFASATAGSVIELEAWA